MLDTHTVDRIKRQSHNSGGFQNNVNELFLDHAANHPANKVIYKDTGVLGEGVTDLQSGRRRRQFFIWDTFKELIQNNTVIDVGCDQAELKSWVTGQYIGIDFWGNYDVQFNLCSGDAIPVADQAGYFVACTDVLEHLFDPHFYCDELFRISEEYVMIGLPNCWYALYPSLRQGYPSYMNYGLAPEKHNDVHRWMFTTEESNDFVLYRAAKNNFECISTINYVSKPNSSLIWRNGGIVSKLFNRLNWYTETAGMKMMDKKYSREWLNRNVSQTWWLLKRKK